MSAARNSGYFSVETGNDPLSGTTGASAPLARANGPLQGPESASARVENTIPDVRADTLEQGISNMASGATAVPGRWGLSAVTMVSPRWPSGYCYSS